MIQCDQVSYNIKGKAILDHVTFALESCERVAVLGHNGAGKSTLMDVLIDYIKPTQGAVSYRNQPFDKVKSEVGLCLFNTPLLSNLLKVKEHLVWVGKLYHISKETTLKQATEDGLSELFAKSLGSLSAGERKKVGLFLSCLNKPKLLLWDEPTASLDPFMRNTIWERVIASQAAVLFSTHIWEEASKYAGSILFLYRGRLLTPKIAVSKAMALLPSDEKLVLPQNTDLSDRVKSDSFSYVSDGKLHLIGEVSPILENMTTAVEYTRTTTSLEDVYRYLIAQQTKP